ncbi:right-handed parallel beta-helix repeat-containing protein [Streptomyces sp. NPDC058220]|uniref:right-handed parallel beta-helix repeat-containing protein n=1 Tax=Streptomyces sp. NPDC058220 TaxID=3346387 RepID=UPI0036E1D871
MAQTVRVSPTATGAFPTIVAALEGTALGERVRILLDAGTYTEKLSIRGMVELAPVDPGAEVTITASGSTTLECSGAVTLEGIRLVSYGATALWCTKGTVTLRDCEVLGQGADGVCVRGDRGTELAMRGTVARGGEVLLAGAKATIEDCRFHDSVGNAIAVVEGGAVTVKDCTITKPAVHGVRVNGSTALIERCDVSGTGNTALSVAYDAEMTVADCAVHDVSTSGIAFLGHATGAVHRTSVDRAEHGISVFDDGEATLKDVRISECRSAGVLMTTRGTSEITDCVINSAARYGIHVAGDSATTVHGLTVDGGEEGVWMSGGRGRFTGVTLKGNDVAVRLEERSYAHFEDLTIERCGVGVEAREKDMSVELTGATISGARRGGIVLAGKARATLSDCSVTGGDAHGVTVDGQARIDATRLTVRGCGGTGVWGKGSARVILNGSTVSGNARGDLRIEDSCEEDVTDSAIGSGPSSTRRPGGPRGAAAVSAAASSGGEGGPDGRSGRTTAPPADHESLTELTRLVGLAPVKRQVRTQINMIKLAQHREAAGLPTPALSRHLVFSGPPGTGKTTVARLYGQILAALGVLTNGEVHEVSRSELVGQYLGSTAQKTRDVFTKATGGVLFIDEAYALSRKFGVNADFGQESIDELVTLMENRREDVVVIVAGYTAEMNDFLDANPGLRSRFSRTIEFPPYSVEELVEITELIADTNQYVLDEAVPPLLRGHFGRLAAEGGESSNAREARKLFERMVEQHAERLSTVDRPGLEQLMLLMAADLPLPT